MAQERGELVVPADAEAVVPTTKDGESRAKVQVRLTGTLSRTILARGNVADIIDEVGVNRARLEGVLDVAERGGGQLLVATDRPLHARELFCELRSIVAQPVPLFRCQVITPVRHFQVPFQQRCRDHRLGEFVADGEGVCCSGCDLGGVVGTVRVGRALALGVRSRFRFEACCASKVRNLGAGELQLGLLRKSRIGRVDIAGEGIGEELTFNLADGSRTRAQRVQDVIRDSQSDLGLSGERLREMDHEVPEVTVIGLAPMLPITIGGRLTCENQHQQLPRRISPSQLPSCPSLPSSQPCQTRPQGTAGSSRSAAACPHSPRPH